MAAYWADCCLLALPVAALAAVQEKVCSSGVGMPNGLIPRLLRVMVSFPDYSSSARGVMHTQNSS